MMRSWSLCHTLLLLLSACCRGVLFLRTTVTAQDGAATAVTIQDAPDVPEWPPARRARASVQDLHGEYHRIFPHGNRNAASHLWSTFLLERAHQMTPERLTLFFTGFCVVSGSPVRPSDYNRYLLRLPSAHDDDLKYAASMHYCCWPCVCDVQDFVKVDTLTVTTVDGVREQRHFAVMGNPCDDPAALEVPFVQPFDYYQRPTTIAASAPELRCGPDGALLGATLSDHGRIIVGMVFDATPIVDDAVPLTDPTPGRISRDRHGNDLQDEREFRHQCDDRAANGYNSGMGEIFRRVCAVSPLHEAVPHATRAESKQVTMEG